MTSRLDSMNKSLDDQDIRGNGVVGAVSALLRAEHEHAAHLARAMGLPAADMLALYHLADEALSAKVLGQRLGLTSGSVTSLIDRLVDRKLARRTTDPSDRRGVLVEMTKHGRNTSWRQLRHFVTATIAISEALSAADQRVVESFLVALVEATKADTERLRA
jgi:DNA-binding MarR family transcriptional regulator